MSSQNHFDTVLGQKAASLNRAVEVRARPHLVWLPDVILLIGWVRPEEIAHDTLFWDLAESINFL